MALVYVSVVLVGTLGGAFLYMLCMNLTRLVVGASLPFFSADFFLRGIFLLMPLMGMLACVLMILYEIRHSSGNFVKTIAFLIFGLFTWLFLIPLSLKCFSVHEDMREDKNLAKMLSPEFFRREYRGIYYYSRILPDLTADGLYINLEGINGEQGRVTVLKKSGIHAFSDSDFADPLIEDGIKMPVVLKAPLEVYDGLYRRAKTLFDMGYIYYLLFASAGLAFIGICGLRFCSTWRLLNALIVVLSSCLISAINYAFYYLPFFSKSKLNLFVVRFFSEIGFVYTDVTILVINILVCIVCSLIGLTSFRLTANTESEEYTSLPAEGFDEEDL